MSRIFYLPSFIKQLRKLRGREARAVQEALIAFDHFEDKFEIRIDLRKRIVMKQIESDYYLALYGDHADIEHFLRRQ